MTGKSWKQLQAEQKEWDDKCNMAWAWAADRLLLDGYQQIDQPGNIIPALFVKGEETLYLARQPGSSQWYREVKNDAKSI